jgi:serine/threonine protein kinase
MHFCAVSQSGRMSPKRAKLSLGIFAFALQGWDFRTTLALESARVTLAAKKSWSRFLTRSAEPSSKPTQSKRGLRLRHRMAFGRYVVLEALGRGGMGVVYLAYDPELGRKLALKVIRLNAKAGEGDLGHEREEVVQEARSLARISHPNIVSIYDVGVQGDELYMATEFVEGMTLREWIGSSPRPKWHAICEVMLQLAAGISVVHNAGMVHRDIKPDNVLLTDDGRVVLIDFGLARVQRKFPRSLRPGSMDSLDCELEERIEGTPSYMAPEQHLGEAVTPAADIYAFCVSFYEALAGIRPFRGDNPEELLRNISLARIVPAKRRFPRSLLRIVKRGMQAEENERWASIDELVEALHQVRSGIKARRSRLAMALSTGAASVWAALSLMRSDYAVEDPLLVRFDSLHFEERLAAAHTSFLALRSNALIDQWPAIESALRERNDSLAAALDVSQHGHPSTWSPRFVQCMDERLAESDAILNLLANVNVRVAAQSLAGVRALGAVESCRDSRQSVALPLPRDRALSLRVNEARTLLHRVRVLAASGGLDEADREASDLLHLAKELGYFPLLAEVHRELGLLNMHSIRGIRSRDHFEKALLFGLTGRHDSVAAFAASYLLFADLYLVGNEGASKEGLSNGFAFLQRAEFPARAHAEWQRVSAIVGMATGRKNDCLVPIRTALSEEWRALETDLPMRVTRLSDVAECLSQRQDYRESRQAFMRALSYGRNALGDYHPALFLPLLNLGELTTNLGQLAESQEWVAQGEAVLTQSISHDPRSAWLCIVRTKLALARLEIEPSLFEREGCLPSDDQDLATAQHHRLDHRALILTGRAWIGKARAVNAELWADVQRGAFRGAIDAFSEAAMRGLLRLALFLRDAEAIEFFAKRIAFSAGAPDDLTLQANIALVAGEWQQAQELADQALDAAWKSAYRGYSPMISVPAIVIRGQASALLGQSSAAQRDLEFAVMTIESELGKDSPRLFEPLMEQAMLPSIDAERRKSLLHRGMQIAQNHHLAPPFWRERIARSGLTHGSPELSHWLSTLP